MAQTISSKHNPFIKLIKSLEQKKIRKEHNLAIIEGAKIIDEAIEARVNFSKLIIEENKKEEYRHYLHKLPVDVVYVPDFLFKHLSSTTSPQGIMAIIDTSSLDPIIIKGDFLILDNIQDPGNLGAIIRSAAASGFLNIFMINCVDVYSDKVIRASMGNLFKTKNHSVTFEKLQELVSAKSETPIFLLDTKGEDLYSTSFDNFKEVGIILGSEGQGVSPKVATLGTKTLAIPMQNKVESLNVAVSASILMYKLRYGKN